MEVAQVIFGVGVVFVAVVGYVIQNMLQVCDPSEVFVISGSSDRLNQREIGYKAVKGGRAIIYPLIEKLHSMDLRNLTIDVAVKNAYSKGGIPLNIEGVANVKVCGDQPLLHNAIERFLGTPTDHIVQIAKETLEGNLRGVLARLTPEEVNHDKVRFAQCLVEEADKDLHRLGLTLDNLKIQNVHDDVGYLDCIGRKRRSEQMKTNRIAEVSNRAEAALVEAENRQKKSLIDIENKMKILKAEAETKIADARTRRAALVAEEEAKVLKQIAKAESEIPVWQAQIEQVQHRLRADVIQPADAERRKTVAMAQAQVAPIREAGRATAEMLDYVLSSWRKAGPRAREVFLMQKLDGFIDSILHTVPEATVDRLTVVGRSDQGSSTLLMQLAALVDQFRAAAEPTARKAVTGPGPVTPAPVAKPVEPQVVAPPPVPQVPAPVVRPAPVAEDPGVVTLAEVIEDTSSSRSGTMPMGNRQPQRDQRGSGGRGRR